MRAGASGFLRRNMRILLAATLAALLFGLLFALFSPTRYRSSAQLLIDPRGLQILKNDITRASETTDGALVDIENQRYILLSRSILQSVVDHENLEDNPLFGGAAPGLLSKIAAAVGVKRPALDRRARAVQALSDMIEVVRGERAYILDVVVTTPDPNLSASLANIIARTYLDAQNDARSNAAKRASEELTKRAEELRKQVQTAEERVQSYRSQHNLLVTPTGALLSDQQISDISNQVGLVRARIAEAQARVEAAERFRKSGLNLDSLTESLTSPTMVALRGQYAQAAQQAGSLATQLGPRHPALVQAQEQVRDIRRQIESELERVAGAARSDLARARASEGALQKQIGNVSVTTDKNNVALVELRDLERGAEASRAVYQAYLSRAKELGESQGIDSTNARVISPAIPAAKPTGAPLPLILAGALLFGLTLGAGLAHLRERFDDRIRTRQQLTDLTGLPILAAFRTHNSTGDKRAPGDLVPDRAGFRTLLKRIGVDRGERDVSVAFVGRRDTTLATQLVVGAAEFARWESLDVALLDCAPAGKPRLIDVFDSAAETQSETGRRQGHIDVVHLDDLLRNGSTRRLRREFRDLSGDCDVIFADAPDPLENRDALAVLDLVDTIVLVIEPQQLDRNAIEAMMQGFEDYADKVAGLVLIGPDELR